MYFLYPFSLDAFGRRTRSLGPGDDGALERSIEEPRDIFRSYLSDHRSLFRRGEAAIALRVASFFEPRRAAWGFPEPRKADIRAIRNRPGPRPSPAPRPTLTSSIFTPALFSRFFETFSFLPPLSDQEIARQVQYLLNNGWTPCIEFESADKAYADSHGWSGLDSSVVAGYYDNRYWVMWKLPMYGCTNPEEVLSEIRACTSAFPDCFIRVAGFDNIKQVQCSSFLAHRPANDRTFAAVNNRQAGGSSMGGGYGAAPAPPPQQQNYSW
jgi:ribulose-bisphosphate carboxylase small chain